MTAASKERLDQVRDTVREILAGKTSNLFLGRIDKIIEEWAAGTLTAAQACEKIQKLVRLFIGEEQAAEIGKRCAPIVMKESAENR